MRRILPLLFAVLLFPLAALAAQAIPDPSQLDAFAQAAVAALTSGNTPALVCLGVIALVYLLRLLPISALRTDRGGTLLALVTSIAGALYFLPAGTSLLSVAALVAVIKVLVGSIGSFTFLTKLFAPSDVKRAEAAGAQAAAEIAGKTGAVAVLDALQMGERK